MLQNSFVLLKKQIGCLDSKLFVYQKRFPQFTKIVDSGLLRINQFANELNGFIKIFQNDDSIYGKLSRSIVDKKVFSIDYFIESDEFTIEEKIKYGDLQIEIIGIDHDDNFYNFNVYSNTLKKEYYISVDRRGKYSSQDQKYFYFIKGHQISGSAKWLENKNNMMSMFHSAIEKS